MILESLVKYYEALAEKGELAKPGWSQVDVSYALDIDINGNLKRVISLKKQDGKKIVPQKMFLPSPEIKGNAIKPNFLYENSTYLLGIDNKEKPEWSKERFLATKEMYKINLPDDENACKAVKNFFDNWDIDKANESNALNELKNEIVKGGNIVFLYEGKYLHDNEAVKDIWDSMCQISSGGKIRCSLTGRFDSLATLHPKIKRVRDAMGGGASLVSFDKEAFTSFGKKQGANAQIGEYAAFAYGEALNYLTERITDKNYLGNTAILFYAINGEREYQDAFSAIFLGNDDYYSKEDLMKLVEDICEGHAVDFEDKRLDPQMEFYLLGLAPNNGRLSIRLFERGTFGGFVKNIKEHQERLSIKSSKEATGLLSTGQILEETCRNGDKKYMSPVLAGELTRSIIENTRYPATLINAIDLRIRADHDVGQRRASIIKAYYLKNENKQVPKEVLTVGLNKETNNVPYNLGRLFAVLERIQEAANPELNATIKDKYFGGASSTPATIIPKLIDLSQNHLRKLNTGMKIYYSKQLGEILEKFEEGYPKTLSMPERGAFQLGYYHQVQDYFKSKKVEG